MSVLASLLWKRKVRDGAMAKALLPLLALRNGALRNLGLEEGQEHYPVGDGHTISSLQVLHPRGSKDFGVSQGRI